VRTLRYRTISDDLRGRLAAGEFAAGRMLPSEADLAAAYDASRVTVRRALEVLREEGLVDSRQGFGWFAAADPLRQHLARLGTIEAQLAESGVRAERRVLEFAFVRASGRVRAALGVEDVLRVRRVNLADGVPFARITVWVPGDLGSQLSRAEVERSTFLELLPVALGRAVQIIGAGAATAADAQALDIPAGAPVLRCSRTTYGVDGRAVLYAEHVFPAHRTEFVVELTSVERSMAPTGLRLVD
jgi:GntR family transcriptional regulator